MAHAVQLTISTGNRVSITTQSQEVSVSLTYELGREDTDVLAVTSEKACEVAAAHRIAWERMRDAKVNGKKVSETEKSEAKLEEPSSGIEEHLANLPSQQTASTKAENGVVDVPIAPLTSGQSAAIQALVAQAGWGEAQLQKYLCDHFGAQEISELSTAQAAQMLLELQREERLKTQSRSQERRGNTARLNGHP